jgi:LEA14-like dessication related protein
MNRLIYSVLFLIIWLGGCASMSRDFDPPRVDLAGLEPMQSGSMEPRFLLKMRVVNPNDKALTIKGIYYEISVEGNELFTGASNAQTVIPAYGENIVMLEAATSLFGTIGLFKSLMTTAGSKGAINYELYTKIAIVGMMLPIKKTHTGKLDLSGVTSGQKSI